jgi:hypothetical protein
MDPMKPETPRTLELAQWLRTLADDEYQGWPQDQADLHEAADLLSRPADPPAADLREDDASREAAKRMSVRGPSSLPIDALRYARALVANRLDVEAPTNAAIIRRYVAELDALLRGATGATHAE